MNVCVVGTGYVGLVTGTCLADLGNTVTCIDLDQTKLELLNNGHVPFFEPQLEELITRSRNAGRLFFSDRLEEAVCDASVVFIAVGTPPLETGAADLSAVFDVAQSICDIYKRHQFAELKVIVTKSTVPIGTGQKIKAIRDEKGLDFCQLSVVSNPEFLREGTAVYDFFHPDRIVLGGDNEDALDVVAKLYDPLYRRETPVVRTNLESSELSKYASNAFLATKISFINEIATLCEAAGADIHDVARIMRLDGRIGKYFLHPGPGYGGSCFPKDTKALIYQAQTLFDYDLKIVKSAEAVNEQQKVRCLDYIKQRFGADLTGKKFAVLGLAFKPNTDDIRESSSLVLIEALLQAGAVVYAVDPEVQQVAQFDQSDSFHIVGTSYEAADQSHCVVLMTEWNAFRELDLGRLKAGMKESVFFDMRNVYSPENLEKAGFEAYVVGRCVLSQFASTGP